MFLFRGSEQWHGFSFLGDHFNVVAIGSKLYVIVPFCVGSAYVVWFFLVLACVRQSLLLLMYRRPFFSNKGTDTLAGVADLDADIPQ